MISIKQQLILALTLCTLTGVSSAHRSTTLATRAQEDGPACTSSWIPTFGALSGFENEAFVAETFDDGTGPALYVGGRFESGHGVGASLISRFDGTDWSAVGGGLDYQGLAGVGSVNALAIFDDGSGPALIVAGAFTHAGGLPANRIAKWDGTSWSTLGAGLGGFVSNERVEALVVHDDGSGPALYASGRFSDSGGTPLEHTAKWDGVSWTAVGSYFTANNPPTTLESFDDGNGPALYAGSRGPLGLAKWDGTSWTGIATGSVSLVETLKVYDDGTGAKLLVGGVLAAVGTLPPTGLAAWDGATWSSLGQDAPGRVRALEVFDDGMGPELYAGGGFLTAGGGPARNIAKWTGTVWTSLPAGEINNPPLDMIVFDDGNGPELYFLGPQITDGFRVEYIVKWSNSAWHPTGTGLGHFVNALRTWDDGAGEALYVGGDFVRVAELELNRVGRWDGISWSALSSGMDGPVEELEVVNYGVGPQLVAGGDFTTAGGVAANGIASWDGTAWTAFGSGLSGRVNALIGFDLGSGPVLVAGGSNIVFDGVEFHQVAYWDGSSWQPLGTDPDALDGAVEDLEIYDDGNGPQLYAAGGRPTNGFVVRFDGPDWQEILSTYRPRYCLQVFDDGGGEALYAGGTSVGKYSNSTWSVLGTANLGSILDFEVSTDGSGPMLYASGGYRNLGSNGVNNIARLESNGSWTHVGSGIELSDLGIFNLMSALEVFDVQDGSGPSLYVGGSFKRVLDSGDAFLARWGCDSSTLPIETCTGDGGDQLGCTDCPCGNNAAVGAGGGCLNSSGTSAQLIAWGTPRVSTDSLRFDLSGANPATFGILASGDNLLPNQGPCSPGSGILSPGILDGLRCVGGALQRHGTRATDSSGDIGLTNNGWGPPSGPPNGIIDQGAFAAGQTRHFQCFYRELASAGCQTGQNTSQAVSLSFTP